MRANSPAARLAVGMISAVTAASMFAPSAAGSVPHSTNARLGASAVTSAAERPATTHTLLLIPTAPIGMAGPAAPAPIKLVAATPTGNPKDGYINEQDWAARSAANLAATQAGLGALWGAGAGLLIGGIAGGVVGVVVGGATAPIIGPVAIVPIVVGVVGGAVIGAAIGSAVGASVGAISGANTGYADGLGDARWHNWKVRQAKNHGPPKATTGFNAGPPAASNLQPRMRVANRTARIAAPLVTVNAQRAAADLQHAADQVTQGLRLAPR